MANLYKSFNSADAAKNREGGYTAKIWVAPVGDFLSLKEPVVGETPALGDTKKITTAHTFGSGNGFVALTCRKDSVKVTAASVGEAGAKQFEWTLTAIITGDSAQHIEQLEGFLNDELVLLAKDQTVPGPTEYSQLGDGSVQPEITVEFDSQDTATGAKFYRLTAKIRGHRYFYSGTVSLKS